MAIGMSDINSVNLPLPVDASREIKKGEEIGYFAYGGSGIVMLFEPGVLRMSRDGKDREAASPNGRFVRMGTKIGTLNVE